MEKVKIAVIDTGIYGECPCAHVISKSYALCKLDDLFSIKLERPTDFVGHGTAVANIIYKQNPNIDIISFRICGEDMTIDEDGLLFVLKYIYYNIDVDLINISAGLTYLYKYSELKDICHNFSIKKTIIVSAFDNDGAITYPAALDEVIGVDTTSNYVNKNEIQYLRNSIVDILVPDIFYRTIWKQNRTVLKGTSFATARITGIISTCLPIYEKDRLLSHISNYTFELPSTANLSKPNFIIQKAILFPINKESHAILHFKHLLPFELCGVYDERLSGNVKKTICGYEVKSFYSINWEDDFDTIILSCTTQLSLLTNRNYYTEIISKSNKYNKNIYTFEDIKNEDKNIFFPKLTDSMTPIRNNGKLHKTTLPVVGVFNEFSNRANTLYK